MAGDGRLWWEDGVEKAKVIVDAFKEPFAKPRLKLEPGVPQPIQIQLEDPLVKTVTWTPLPGPHPEIAAMWLSRALASQGLRVLRHAPMLDDTNKNDFDPSELFVEGHRILVQHRPDLEFEGPGDYRYDTVGYWCSESGSLLKGQSFAAIVVVSAGYYGYVVIPEELANGNYQVANRRALRKDGFVKVQEVATDQTKALSWLVEQRKADTEIPEARMNRRYRTVLGFDWQSEWAPVEKTWEAPTPILLSDGRLDPKDVRLSEDHCNLCGAPKPPASPAFCYPCHVSSRAYSHEQATVTHIPKVRPIPRHQRGRMDESDPSLLSLLAALDGGIWTKDGGTRTKRADGRLRDILYDDEITEDD